MLCFVFFLLIFEPKFCVFLFAKSDVGVTIFLIDIYMSLFL
ncbi:hypothetical protein O185_02675 [Photorhabdus temperata J3]|uniref:Uncharacterized protein n=1 Tax=Photorhabdus temperata J3 TaxID=1389415 RepID=U7R3Q0_PHOTE|nr:hypothetical protein O185_02675 [Photorhabdus temperata J3]